MDPIARAAKIKSDLYKVGFSLNEVDRRFNLPRNSVSKCLAVPIAAAEKAIAEVLATPAHVLFPERYESGGQRKTPQPPENYSRPPTMAQRRKERAA